MSALRRSIALVGIGALGTPILRALLNSPNHPNVIVLTRPESKGRDLPSELPSGSIIPVDYADSLPFPGYKARYTLADAAKASGSVKLFVPSEWGSPTEGAKEKGEDNIFAVKNGVSEYLKSIGLPYTRFFTCLFMGYVPWVVGSDVDGKAHILGKGDTPFSVTSQEDIGGFVAHVLTSLPLNSSELVNACLRIQGQQITLRQFARVANKQIVAVTGEQPIPGKIAAETIFNVFLQTYIEEGMATTGWDHKTEKELDGATGSANKLWEGHIWQTIENTF
ncbi:hypothetical protein J3R30DRAFT_3734396 [Lentinula aciculospora]|uniref:NmrA-like domain-containing protein n=1 Tax=Lentinula aciculospora TaxID=153920 RepID=A0A9W9DM94_9AGAR|nr:hypothetical protein J3R30DRAFT_3734396 [Lentinula aciculospora]